MSDICPKQQLIDKIRTEINSATSQLEKFEEENGADLTDVSEDLEEALRAVSELEQALACTGADKEEPLNPEGVDSAKPVDPTGEVPPAPPEEGE